MDQRQQALSKLLGGAVDTGDSDSLQLPQTEEQRQTIANKRHDRESLVQQRNQLQVRLQQLEVQKDRLTLRAPEDGKVLKLLAKQGEIVQADTPVILLESKRQYYDIYVSEKQAVHLHEGQAVRPGQTIEVTGPELPET